MLNIRPEEPLKAALKQETSDAGFFSDEKPASSFFGIWPRHGLIRHRVGRMQIHGDLMGRQGIIASTPFQGAEIFSTMNGTQ